MERGKSESKRIYGGKYEILSPDKAVEGHSYGEWIARYCQWLTSIPKDHNPLFDKTGENISRQQMGPVFFLPNAPENSEVQRKCTISSEKIVLVAVNTSLTISAEHQDRTSQDLRIIAMRQELAVPEIGLLINNKTVDWPDFKRYRLGSPLFNLLLKENNIFGVNVEPGKVLPTVGLAEGYWVMIRFWTGNYALHFRVKGTYDDEQELEIPFETDVLYDLTVVQKVASPYDKGVPTDISPSIRVINTEKSSDKARGKARAE